MPVTFAAVCVCFPCFFLLPHWLEAMCWKAVVTADEVEFSTGPLLPSAPDVVPILGLGDDELGLGLGEPVPVLVPLGAGDPERGGALSVPDGLGEHVGELDAAGVPVGTPLDPNGLAVFDRPDPGPVLLPGPVPEFCEFRPAVLLMKSEVLNAT